MIIQSEYIYLTGITFMVNLKTNIISRKSNQTCDVINNILSEFKNPNNHHQAPNGLQISSNKNT